MTLDNLKTLIQTILMFAGGFLVDKGLVDATTLTAIVGGAVAVAAAVWNATHKQKLADALPAK